MSWWAPKASYYRKMEKIPDEIGTAASVQAMVFGNMGDTSATGVAFTRNPSTGEKRLYGEFLINAQGEDVVAGIRNTVPLQDLAVPYAAGICAHLQVEDRHIRAVQPGHRQRLGEQQAAFDVGEPALPLLADRDEHRPPVVERVDHDHHDRQDEQLGDAEKLHVEPEGVEDLREAVLVDAPVEEVRLERARDRAPALERERELLLGHRSAAAPCCPRQSTRLFPPA